MPRRAEERALLRRRALFARNNRGRVPTVTCLHSVGTAGDKCQLELTRVYVRVYLRVYMTHRNEQTCGRPVFRGLSNAKRRGLRCAASSQGVGHHTPLACQPLTSGRLP